jgi:hypothetical protein
MDRRLAAVVGVLFLATFVGLQNSGTTSGTSGGDAGKSAPSAPGKDSIVIPLTELGPWEASCDYYQPNWAAKTQEKAGDVPGLPLQLTQPVTKQLQQLDGKKPDGKPDLLVRWCAPENDPPEFLIVTVPDPVNSHLALEFDRRMDAIAWAATDAGFVNDQFWLPWDAEAAKASDDPDKARTATMLAEVRQLQPGLLIFRPTDKSKKRPLFVFLAGETPTYGINKDQLKNALDYIRIISGNSQALSQEPNTRILGPGFSGSVNSILQVLKGYPCVHCFHIIPSSATDRDALDLLNTPSSTHNEVLYDDQASNMSFLCFVHDQLLLDPKYVATLSESETTFGAIEETYALPKDSESPAPPCGVKMDEVTRLRFPREIASLRNAYPDRPLSPSAVPATAKPQETPFLGLPLHLRDPGIQITPDSVPEFSREQIPLSQEAVLYQIASTIRRKKIKLIEIRATNIFDTLFLASFLRESCPDARLAVLDSDLLLIRATGTIPLEGMLTVSTYPLIPLNQSWTATHHASKQLILTFPNQASEATYNGFLALTAGYGLREYESPQPDDSRQHPALWVSAVGRNGFIPIALLPVPNSKTGPPWWTVKPSLQALRSLFPGSKQYSLADSIKPEFKIEMLKFEPPLRFHAPPPSGSYLFMAGTTLVFALFGHAFGILQRNGPRGPFPQWWLENFNVEGFLERGQKLHFLLAATLTLVIFSNLVFLPIWQYTYSTLFEDTTVPFSFPQSLFNNSWFCIFSVISLLVVVFLLAQACQLHRDASAANPPPPPLFLWSAWMSAALVLEIWILLGIAGGTGMHSEFFLYRTTELASGVSPLVPILLLLAALYVWSWMHLRRIRYWELRRTDIPTTRLDAEFQFGLTEKNRELDGNLRYINLDGWLLRIVLAMTFLLVALSRIGSHVAGLEPFAIASSNFNLFSFNLYNGLCLFTLFWLWGFLFAAWIRFIHCWHMMQIILGRLERTILRRAFDRLPKRYYSWAPLWQAMGGRRSFVILARARECLEKLLQEKDDDVLDLGDIRLREAQDDPLDPSLFTRLNQFFEEESTGSLNLAEPLLAVQVRMRRISEELLEKLLPYWRENGGSDTLEDIEANKKDPPQLPQQILLAEEFVALRFMAMIRYVSLQLRNLLSFIMVDFILSVFALRSYPFLAGRAIGWTLTLIFAALGTGVVVVFAQMSKDAILSRIANTEPGKLGGDFYFRIISFGALPVLTLLASQFPSIGRFLFSWVQPGIEAFH